MTENNATESVSTVSTEETVSSVPTVKSVLSVLYGDATFGNGDEMSGSFGTRQESGFDQLDRSAKSAAKKAVEAKMRHSLRNGQFAMAKALDDILTGLSGSTVTTKVVTEDDVRAVLAEKVAMLRYAELALIAGHVEVAGYDGIVPILEESDIADATDGSDEWAEKALKFATVAFGTKTKQHDIPALLREAFEGVESGTFFRISEIRGRIAKNHPELDITSTWDGRLNAALFADGWDATDIQPVSSKSPEAFQWDDKGRAGAFRTEHVAE
jgi:hypothetical protein